MTASPVLNGVYTVTASDWENIVPMQKKCVELYAAKNENEIAAFGFQIEKTLLRGSKGAISYTRDGDSYILLSGCAAANKVPGDDYLEPKYITLPYSPTPAVKVFPSQYNLFYTVLSSLSGILPEGCPAVGALHFCGDYGNGVVAFMLASYFSFMGLPKVGCYVYNCEIELPTQLSSWVCEIVGYDWYKSTWWVAKDTGAV